MDLTVLIEPLSGQLAILAGASVLVTILVHILCAVWVSRASRLYVVEVHRDLIILPRFLWILVTLVTGLFAALGFWLCHCSTLNPRVKHY